jgi:hypothetical protein
MQAFSSWWVGQHSDPVVLVRLLLHFVASRERLSRTL